MKGNGRSGVVEYRSVGFQHPWFFPVQIIMLRFT